MKSLYWLLTLCALGLSSSLKAAPTPQAQIQGNQGLLTCMKPFIPYIYIPLSISMASEDLPQQTSITVSYNGTDVLTEKSSLLLSIGAVINSFESPTMISTESPSQTFPLSAEHILCPGSLGLSLVRLYGFESVPTGSYKLKVKLAGNNFSAEFLIGTLEVTNSITLTGNGADQTTSTPAVLGVESSVDAPGSSSATAGAKGCTLTTLDSPISIVKTLMISALFTLCFALIFKLRSQRIR